MLLRDNIYDAVRADILACRLVPGEELREQDLAARYNVSRAPVRDALLRLEQDQLVTVHPRQGYSVNRISIADACEIFQYRVVLESNCASLAAEHASVEELDRLEQFRAVAAGTDFIDYNHDFHSAVAAASGNRRMAKALADLVDQAERFVRISVSSIKGHDPAQLIAEHGALIDALQRRDARGAARLVEMHVTKAERRIIAALNRSAVIP
ncbi:MAG TPA: GntR family transcriptional regulator [Stellaceae bacterium]|nr:GntR family transcriptional regulator [Stellaceae bacterium]